MEYVSRRFVDEGIEAVAEFYTRGPNRVQFEEKDPRGWREVYESFRSSSALGHANTTLGVQRNRPSVHELESRLETLEVPTLIVIDDEDEPCLDVGLYMKRTIPARRPRRRPEDGPHAQPGRA